MKHSAGRGTGNHGRRPGEDEQASQYARSLIEASLDPLVTISPEGKITDYPLTIRHKDGRLTDVLYNASVYKDVAGNVLGVFAAARDVTAQKQVSQYARSLVEASFASLLTVSDFLSELTACHQGSSPESMPKGTRGMTDLGRVRR